MSSLPSRRTASPSADAATPSLPLSPVALGDRQQEFNDLMTRREGLQRRRGQAEARLQVAETTIQECQREASQYGVETLEDLEALIARQEEDERKSLAAFHTALDAEERLLTAIEGETAGA